MSFDLRKFMESLESNAELEQDILEEGTRDWFPYYMRHLAPKLWAVILEDVERAGNDMGQQNAVMNAAVAGVVLYCVAVCPRDSLGSLRDQLIPTVEDNLGVAGEVHEEVKNMVVRSALSFGKEELLRSLSNANVEALTHVHQALTLLAEEVKRGR